MWMKTKKFQRNMKKFGKVLKKKLERLMVAEKLNIVKKFKKIRLKLRLLTIIIRSGFSEDGKFYPHLFLDDAFYELV